jgi:protein TonB
MFDSFQPQASDAGTKRRFAVSTLAAMGAYVAVALVVATFAQGAVAVQEKIVDVTFEKLPKKEPEPPPPPPRVEPVAKRIEKPKPPPPKPEAPPPPPPPPAPAPVVVPKAVPKEVAREAEPVADKPSFIPPAEGIGGTRGGVPGGVVGGVVGGTGTGAVAAIGPTSTGPINLPEDATPAVESPDNRRPEYPEAARAAGKEGKVILKIVITEAGRVGDIKVLKGDPEFVEAAMSVVKGWRYQPAMLAGKPISVFRIVQIPFRLSIGGN